FLRDLCGFWPRRSGERGAGRDAGGADEEQSVESHGVTPHDHRRPPPPRPPPPRPPPPPPPPLNPPDGRRCCPWNERPCAPRLPTCPACRPSFMPENAPRSGAGRAGCADGRLTAGPPGPRAG